MFIRVRAAAGRAWRALARMSGAPRRHARGQRSRNWRGERSLTAAAVRGSATLAPFAVVAALHLQSRRGSREWAREARLRPALVITFCDASHEPPLLVAYLMRIMTELAV